MISLTEVREDEKEVEASRNEVFQAWVFQKLAGIHVSILKLVS